MEKLIVHFGQIFFGGLQVVCVRSDNIIIFFIQGVAVHSAQLVFHLTGFLGLAKLKDCSTFFAEAEVLVDPEFRGDQVAVHVRKCGSVLRVP